ncbi:MAG: DUF4397 domain-containing protein, partial [Gemmatimonadetes bacterium]|nr:DUF4397 domain-containing protein [Gemmatimonadota bacterium]
MKSALSRFALVGLVAALAACDSDSNDPAATASIRVVHGSPDAPAVDVVRGWPVGPDQRGLSGRLAVSRGEGWHRNVQVRRAGGGATVIDADLVKQDGDVHTVIATNVLASIEPLVLTDDNSAPAAGNFKLRLVHGAPNVGLVDIYITAPGAAIDALTPDLANIPSRGVSSYIEAPAGQVAPRADHAAGTKTVAIDTGHPRPRGGADPHRHCRGGHGWRGAAHGAPPGGQ